MALMYDMETVNKAMQTAASFVASGGTEREKYILNTFAAMKPVELPMLPDKLQAISDRLMEKRERKATIARVKAQAELDTIQRETDAYYDGIYDTLRAVAEEAEKC
jgi:hypothetical protein